MRILLTATSFFVLIRPALSQVINSSFTAPDTVCVNQTFTIQNTTTGSTVNSTYWNFCSPASVMTQTKNLGASGALAWPTFASINNDNGNYYIFVNNNNPSSLARYSYGSNLNNAPVITNLGNFGGTLPSQMEGLRIEKEGANWYGLGVGGQFGSAICRFSFGTSLANTPTLTNMGNIGGLAYPVRLQLIESGGNRYGFTVNHDNNTITRFDFGNSLANVPTGTNLGNIGGLSGPCDIAFAYVGNTWYAFVIGDGNNITRLNFGSSLLNTPTGTNLGNPGGITNGRSIFLETTCNSLKGQIGNGSGNNILDVAFPTGVTGPLVTTNLGNFANFNYVHSIDKYRIGDTVFMYVPNTQSNSLSRIKYVNCINSVPSSTLQNPPPLSYSVAGTYTIVLSNNGLDYNKSVYCKPVVVTNVSAITAFASPSTGICPGQTATLTATGATSYTWNPGNLQGTSVTVTPSTTTIYTVTGTSGSCTAITTTTVLVLPTPTLTAAANPTVVCPGGASTLTASGALTYTWMPGGAISSSIVVTPSNTASYTVTGSNAGICTSSIALTVSVVPTPTITISSSSPTICQGTSTTLVASGATNYTWVPIGTTGASITITPTTNTTYTVNGDNEVCTASTTVSVVVASNPTVTASANNMTVCSGGGSTLTASGASSYTWNPGNIVSATIAVTPTSSTVYTVTGMLGGCTDTETVGITVNSPTITVSSSATTVCKPGGGSATLTASGALSYTWSPGASTATSIVVSPTLSTTYTVSGTNSLGCVSTKTIAITVSPTPTVTIVSSPVSICRGNSATLTASGAVNYTWQAGGSNTASIVVSPTSTTVYTLTGSSGSCSSKKTFTLNVLPSPAINIIPVTPVICKGGTSLLLATGGLTYTWTPGATNGNTVIVSPSVTTSYTVAGTNLAGCSNTAVTTISVNPTPTISTALSATQACSGSSVSITSSGALTYIVLPGVQTGSLVTVTPTTSTTYTVTGVNIFGCTDTKTLALNVLPNPAVVASASGTLLCDGGTFTLFASGASNYTWSPINSSASSVTTTATSSLTTYTLSGMNNGCIGTTTLGVLVINCNNTIFGVTKAAGTPLLIYDNLYTVSFTVTAVNASSLTLNNIVLNEDLSASFPSPATFTVINQPTVTSQNSSLTINPLFDGVSQISLTSPYTSSLAAGKRDTLVFTVRVKPGDFYGPFKNSVIGFADFLNAFTVADSSNDGFAWDPDQDGDPTNNDIPTLISLPYSELFIPNGFSPDDDGKNDLFVIKGLNGRKAKLTIYNRWGNKVYEKSEYDNTWNAFPNAAGLMLGSNKVPASTYYYVLEFLDGAKETKTGFVVVQY